MKSATLIFSLFIASIHFSYAQVYADSISIYKTLGNIEFFQGNEKLKMKQLMQTIQVNEEAHKLMKSARPNYIVSQVLGFIGGAFIGYPLGTAFGGGDPNWGLAGIGLGIVAVSIPFNSIYNKKAEKAISLYNNSIKDTSFWDNKQLNFSVTNYGLGLTLTF